MKTPIVVVSEEEKRLREELATRTDPESRRMKRFLDMPDLSRTPGSPIAEIVEKVLAAPEFKELDIIQVPEIVPADISFDLFDFPADHPARSTSDTYYVDPKHILRTHTTVMWYYYLQNEDVKRRMAAGEPVGCSSFGKVYRKDEIDRNHMNVFHQIDAWYLAPKDKEVIGAEALEHTLKVLGHAIFGPEAQLKIFEDTFPYTDPSRQMEVERNGKWLEVLGSGVVKGSVLEKFGVDSSKWTGWAFGSGIERWAMVSMDLPDIRLLWSADERVKKQLKLGSTFKEVSKFPPITRDISFVVGRDFVPNHYFDLIRDFGGDLIEEVQLLDKYEDEKKFGPDRVSYTYRIIYRHPERTLVSEEIDEIQAKIYDATAAQFKAELR